MMRKAFSVKYREYDVCDRPEPEGYVGHVYYGPLLHGEPDLYPLRMDEPPFTPCVNKREKSSFLDRFPMEYPTGGVGDYRESCLNIRNAQGRMGM